MSSNNKGVTDGIDSVVWASIQNAIISNNKSALAVLQSFVVDIIGLSIKNKSVNHFKEYVNFIPHYYSESYRLFKENPNLKGIYDYCLKECAENLKSIFYALAFAGDESGKKILPIEKQKKLNNFYYLVFSAFSKCLYFAIRNKDFKAFLSLIDSYNEVEEPNSSRNYGIRYEIIALSQSTNQEDGKELARIKLEYEEIARFNVYKRHVLSGIKFWIFYLFSLDKIKAAKAKILSDNVRIPYDDNSEIISDIIFFRGKLGHFYMDWGSWDYTVRPEGVVYSPPSQYNWMTLGFLADLISTDRTYFDFSNLSEEQLANIEFLTSDIEAYTKYFKDEFDKWKDVLNVKSLEELNTRCDNITSLFKAARRKKVGLMEREIADSPLIPDYVEEFKKGIGKAWLNNASIRKIFKRLGNTSVVSADVMLKRIGQRTFLEKGKMMFTNKHHQIIYGIDRIGGQTGLWEEDEFFNSIIIDDANKVYGLSVLELLDKSVAMLNEAGITPDLIFMPMQTIYRDESIFVEDRFSRKSGGDDNTGRFYLGEFDGIPVYSSLSDFLKNKVVVCNFKDAFHMRYKTDENWFDNELKVDVEEVSIANAEVRLAQDPLKWKNYGEETSLSEEDALLLIRTSVFLDVWSLADFQIANQLAYVIGYITP